MIELLSSGEVVVGGETDPEDCYIAPTILRNVPADSPVMQDEIFGPVACLIPFDDEADAVRIANDIGYGLSSYVWTENIGRAHRVAAAIEAGMCFVNSQNVRDLRQPFGGTKATAVGPTEQGTEVFDFYTETKVAYIDYTTAKREGKCTVTSSWASHA